MHSWPTVGGGPGVPGSSSGSPVRIFNQVVFDETIEGTSIVLSSTDFNELLGRADDLAFQVVVPRHNNPTANVTVLFEHSNDGQRFDTHTTLHNAAVSPGRDDPKWSCGPAAGPAETRGRAPAGDREDRLLQLSPAPALGLSA